MKGHPMPLYTLHISGSIPIDIPSGKEVPTTREALTDLYEQCAVDPYDLDDLTLRLEPATPTMQQKYGQ